MKTLLSLLLVLFVFTINAQTKTPKTKTVEIKTSVICECHGNLITKLNYTKGVVFAELDLESQTVTVKYKTKAISDSKVRQIITNIGYHADEMKRNELAFKNLPACCSDVNAVCIGND
jgi:mercuric ion binding protein